MNCQIILLLGLLFCLSIIILTPDENTEPFTQCDHGSSSTCANNNRNPATGLVNYNNFESQPSNVLTDDVTLNLPRPKCDNTLHNDLYCKYCYYDKNGKWKCDQCTKYPQKKDSKFQSRYLRAMEAINEISNAYQDGKIDEYSYHILFTRWLKVYYDVTLLPKDKVEQLFCASYLNIIDSAKDKQIFEDFIYKTWPMKCASRIPSVLYGETNNVIDSSATSNKLNEQPDFDAIDNILKDIKNNEKKIKVTNIDDFRKEWTDLWKNKDAKEGRQADG